MGNLHLWPHRVGGGPCKGRAEPEDTEVPVDAMQN